MRMIDIVEAIHESNSIALITHINPDGDAVGSLIALMLALDKMEKSVYGYCQDDVPKSLCFWTAQTEYQSQQIRLNDTI